MFLAHVEVLISPDAASNLARSARVNLILRTFHFASSDIGFRPTGWPSINRGYDILTGRHDLIRYRGYVSDAQQSYRIAEAEQ